MPNKWKNTGRIRKHFLHKNCELLSLVNLVGPPGAFTCMKEDRSRLSEKYLSEGWIMDMFVAKKSL